MSKALELPQDVKDRLAELQALSERAEAGDKSARKELRKAVRKSAPEIISRASDIGRRGRWALIKTIAAKDPLTEEALVARLDLMLAEVAGPDPSPLEVLLAERACSLWLLVEVLEVLVSAQLSTSVPREQRAGMGFLRGIVKWQESASRRYLAALKTLAQVRRLQSNTPGVQLNIQNNLLWIHGDPSLPSTAMCTHIYEASGASDHKGTYMPNEYRIETRTTPDKLLIRPLSVA